MPSHRHAMRPVLQGHKLQNVALSNHQVRAIARFVDSRTETERLR